MEEKKDNILFAIIGIVFSMLALPITTVLDMSLPVWIAISAYIIWMVLFRKKGYSFIFIAVCLCETAVTADDMDSAMINEMFRYFFYFLLFFPPLIFAIQYIRNPKQHKINLPIFVIIVYFIIGLIYRQQISGIVYVIVSTFVAFGLSFTDNLNYKTSFYLFSTIFLITTLYSALEYHIGLCPYSGIYLTSADYFQGLYTRRAIGLLGNSLIVLAVAILYQAQICNYAIHTGRYPIISQLLCLYLCIIVVSRTAVFALVIFLLLYVILSRKLSLRILGAFIVLSIVAIWAGSSFLADSLGDLMYRFENSDRLHRVSSIGTTWNILKSNLFGVGFENYANAIENYAAYGKESHVNTLDNFFLTQIAHYGLLGLFVLYFYMYYIVKYFKSKYRKANWEDFFLLVIAFGIIGVCFDFEAYYHILFVINALLGGAYCRVAVPDKSNV